MLKVITPEQRKQMYDDFKQGMTIKDIAAKNGVVVKTVQRSIDSACNNGERVRQRGDRLKPNEKAEIRRMYDSEGLHIDVISEKMKVSRACVYKVLFNGKKTVMQHDTEKQEDIDYKLGLNQKRLKAAKTLFNSLEEGQEIEIERLADKRSKKVIVKCKVIQITSNQIIVQDINRPYRKSAITIRDLISTIGGIRINLLSGMCPYKCEG